MTELGTGPLNLQYQGLSSLYETRFGVTDLNVKIIRNHL